MFQAQTSLKQIYNSNFLLQPTSANKGTVLGTDLEFNGHLSAAAENWNASGGARFENWFYYGPGADLNYQNQFIDTQYSYTTGRSTWSIVGNYINAYFVATVPESAQPLGVILGVIGRENRSIGPAWEYKLTEYTKLSLNYQYSDSDYLTEPQAQKAFPNSTSNSGSVGVNHLYSENLSLNGNLTYNGFKTSTGSTIDYVYLMAGFKYSPITTYSLSASGGGQYTQNSNRGFSLGRLITVTKDQFGPIFNIGLNKQLENSTLSFNYSRTIYPSINGILFTSDIVSLNASHKLTSRINGDFTASYYGSTYPLQTGTFGLRTTQEQQNFYRIGGDVSYSLTPQAIVSASYYFVLRDLSGALVSNVYSGAIDAQTVSLSLQYNFDPMNF